MSDGLPPVYPFSAIVGQDRLRKALVLNAVDPSIGGVLIIGERGTAKSTSVRALAALLPPRETVAGCPYGCAPLDRANMCPDCLSRKDPDVTVVPTRVVELPVSATEDRVVGSIDITAAVKRGEKVFEPGILADANGNILYVDEVNLLNDHIVDSLLDVAAMGVNTVEREGISHSHPSRFVLVGTMNPEEGDLRPQLLDRFGLCAVATGIHDTPERLEIVERRLAFEEDPGGFAAGWKRQEEAVSARIVLAREQLPSVGMGRDEMMLAVEICIDSNVVGHRADITVVRTAKAIAALDGRDRVTEEDVIAAAELALPHRAGPPGESRKEEPKEEEPVEDPDPDAESEEGPDESAGGHGDRGESVEGESFSPSEGMEAPDSDGAEELFEVGESHKVRRDAIAGDLRVDSILRSSSGRRSVTESSDGRYIGHRDPSGKPASIAIDATVRAAAAKGRSDDPDRAIDITIHDVKEKVRQRKVGNLLVFLVDASGSMGAERRMSAVKGAILSLLKDAYQKRDRVALIAFRGSVAETVVPPTGSTDLAAKLMAEIPTGGRTPIAAGLKAAGELIRRETSKDRSVKPLLIVMSDGRANVSATGGDPMEEAWAAAEEIGEMKIKSLVLDSETGFLSLGFAKGLADRLGAEYMRLEDLTAETVRGLVEPGGWGRANINARGEG
ncbi:MAG: magnesium chelatase subunit D family protein [Thermoplasmatales archaeon]|nr:magnesium chelatase subunit D family protein [Thermoplasmatales archaeon]